MLQRAQEAHEVEASLLEVVSQSMSLLRRAGRALGGVARRNYRGAAEHLSNSKIPLRLQYTRT